MRQSLPIIGAILTLYSPLVYGRSILKGKTKPHRTTRLVLLIISALTFASILAQQNYVSVWLAGATFLQAAAIFVLSLKRGMGGWAKSDILCLAIALFGIVMWQITKDPTIGLYFAILADFTGMVPAIIKTYHHPETEIWTYFILDSVSAAMTLAAIMVWAPREFAYPAYIMLINSLMVYLIISRGRKLVSKV